MELCGEGCLLAAARNRAGEDSQTLLANENEAMRHRAQVSAHHTLRALLDEGDYVPEPEGVEADRAVLSEMEWVDL